jgi:hypothetical protein
MELIANGQSLPSLARWRIHEPNKHMNTDSERPDDFVRQRLQEWRIESPVPPRFQEQVWRRIEQQESVAAQGFWHGLPTMLAALFARRSWAAGYVAVALIAGTSVGYWQAQEQAGSLSAHLGHQYIQSVDPYQKPRH